MLIDFYMLRDFERTVLAAYRWLSDNYEPGDCIFLFGMSEIHFVQVALLNIFQGFLGVLFKFAFSQQ